MAILTFVVGCMVGWYLHHFFGPQAQAFADAEKAKVEAQIKAKL